MEWSTVLGLLTVTGGATLLGSVPVLFHRHLPARYWCWWESFGGGVMISASIFSLFLPAWRMADSLAPLLWGVLLGLAFILLAARLMQVLTRNTLHRRAYLFVLAMGIHNVPEGISVGVDVAGVGWRESLPLTVAIFVQNLPEGLVSSMIFLLSGFSLSMALLANAVTALIESASALGGYGFAVSTTVNLPLLLSFSGACMSSVVLVELFSRGAQERKENFSPSGAFTGLLVCAVLDLLL